MKKHLAPNLLFALALGALIHALNQHPPGGARWMIFVEEESPLWAKLRYLCESYLWPAVLSFLAITFFQLQFRLASTGASKRTIFALCVFASGAMLLSLRTIAYLPNAAPSYVVGMSAGYTMMSRLYAVRARELFGKVRIPWPVWRGNLAAVAEMDRMVRERMSQRSA